MKLIGLLEEPPPPPPPPPPRCHSPPLFVNSRLNWFLEKNTILCLEQSGFRPGRSTIDNALRLHDDIKDKFVCVVFMDLDGAFDATQHPHIISALQSIGIHGRRAMERYRGNGEVSRQWSALRTHTAHASPAHPTKKTGTREPGTTS